MEEKVLNHVFLPNELPGSSDQEEVSPLILSSFLESLQSFSSFHPKIYKQFKIDLYVLTISNGTTVTDTNEIDSNETEPDEIDSNEIEPDEIDSNEIEPDEIDPNEIQLQLQELQVQYNEQQDFAVDKSISSNHNQFKATDTTLFFLEKSNGLLIVKAVSSEYYLLSAARLSIPNELVFQKTSQNFPSASVYVHKSVVLSPIFSQNIFILMTSSFLLESEESSKGGNKVGEERQVKSPYLLFDWFLPWAEEATKGLLEKKSISPHKLAKPIQIIKKCNDECRYKDTLYPWRRSSLWIATKNYLHFSLVSRFGANKGTFVYKLIMLHYKYELIRKIYERLEDVQPNYDKILFVCRKISVAHSKVEKLASLDEYQGKLFEYFLQRFFFFFFLLPCQDSSFCQKCIIFLSSSLPKIIL